MTRRWLMAGLLWVLAKAEFLESIRSGKARCKSVTFDDRRVRLHGDSTAIGYSSRRSSRNTAR